MNALQREFQAPSALLKGVQYALDLWICFRNNGKDLAIRERKLQMQEQLRSHLDTIEGADNALIRSLHEQLRKHCYSFFKASEASKASGGSEYLLEFRQILAVANCRLPVYTGLKHLNWPNQHTSIHFSTQADRMLDNTIFAIGIDIHMRGTCLEQCNLDAPIVDQIGLVG